MPFEEGVDDEPAQTDLTAANCEPPDEFRMPCGGMPRDTCPLASITFRQADSCSKDLVIESH